MCAGTGMNHADTEPQWPLWIWALQLIPIGGVTAYGVIRLKLVFKDADAERITVLILCLSGIWTAVVLTALLKPNARRWLVRRRREWCLSAISAVVCLAVGDLVLSLTGVVPTVAEQRANSLGYSYGEFTSYRLVPKKIPTSDERAIHINKRGLRGAEIVPEKPADRIRILFLGGSHVFDFHGGNWPGMVEDLLTGRGHNVEVLNAGVPGYNSTHAQAALLTDYWILQPDIVFMCSAWNDVKYFARLSPASPNRGLPPNEPISWRKDWRIYPTGIDRLLTSSSIYRRFREGLVRFLITEEGFKIFGAGSDHWRPDNPDAFGAWGPQQYRLNLEVIAEISEQIQAQLVLCKQARRSSGRGTSGIDVHDYTLRNTGLSQSALTRAYEACDAIIDDIARARDVFVVDMDKALSQRADYFHDAVHFNPMGSAAAAQFVAKQLDTLFFDDPDSQPATPETHATTP